MEWEKVPENALPKDYKNEEDVPWFVHNRENPEIVDKVERRADVYIRRILRVEKQRSENQNQSQDPLDSFTPEWGWYEDLCRFASEVPGINEKKDRPFLDEEFSGWTRDDFRELIDQLNDDPRVAKIISERQEYLHL